MTFVLRNKEVKELLADGKHYAEVKEYINEKDFKSHNMIQQRLIGDELDNINYENTVFLMIEVIQKTLGKVIYPCSLKIERVKYKIPTLDITIRYVYDRKVK
jgi:hypothetical protein